MKKLLVALAILCAAPPALAQTAVEAVQFTVPTTSAAEACDLNKPCLRLDSSDGHLHWSNVGAGVADGELGGTPNPILLPFTDSNSYTNSIQLGSGLPGVWALITPGDTNPYSSFYFTYQSNAVNGPGALANDNVTSIGPNCGPGGGILNAGHMANCLKFENYYRPDPIGFPNDYQSETHLSIFNKNAEETRVFSVLGPENGYPDLHFSAAQIHMEIGRDLNAPHAFDLDATTTTWHSPAGPNGHLALLLDDNTHEAILSAADAGGHYASLTLAGPSGVSLLDSTNVTRITNNGNVALEANGDDGRVYDPLNSTTFLQVSDNGLYSWYHGALKFAVGATATASNQNFRPGSDSVLHLGAPGARWNDVAVGGPIEGQEGCNSDSRGTLMPVFDPIVDTLQVCLGKAGVYSWYTAFTPP
jgi:hypothetical protein